MNRTHLTDYECAQLYAQWCEKVAGRVRAVAAKAHGRPDRHRGDLEDLHRDLGSVDLRGLLEPEPAAQPGTPIQAVAEADAYLAEAGRQHACGAYKAALVYLQQAHLSANHAVRLLRRTANPGVHDALTEGRIPPRPPAPAAATAEPDQPQDPDSGPGPVAWIPRQRG